VKAFWLILGNVFADIGLWAMAKASACHARAGLEPHPREPACRR
jgi:hypothetical protein